MKEDTAIVHLGREPEKHQGIVNPPVYHASTILFPTVEDYLNRGKGELKYRGVRYGALGIPTTFALADTMAELEGGAGAIVVSSGLSAITFAILALVKQGDHILVCDSAYGPTRTYCDTMLTRFGVETTYYDPLIGKDISTLFKENTALVFTESPGSMTFEVQDIPAICSAAHDRDLPVVMDNTWASPLFFKPFVHGVDVSIQAGTKYISGSSDLVIGIITAKTESLFRRIKDTTMAFGEIAAPDDCYLTLRGLRSMGARLRQQQAAALKITQWLHERPEINRVLYPPLTDDPGHTLWKRDFEGASSLFGLILNTESPEAASKMIDGYRYFKIGSSWGGFESLAIPANPTITRTSIPWTEKGYAIRMHIGLEDPEDLIADLTDGFHRLNQALA